MIGWRRWLGALWMGIGGLAAVTVCAQGGPPEVRDMFDLEREYVRARGGRVVIEETRTALIRGRFLQGDAVVNFQSYRRRPNLYRLDYTLAGLEIREGFDGSTPWRLLPGPSGRQVERLTGPMADRLRREAEFESPIVSHREKDARLSYQGIERVGDHTCHVVRIEPRQGPAEVWYIDQETFLEVESHRVGADGVTVITRFHDWRRVDQRPVAHRVETYLGDELVSVTLLDRVQWNIGLLSDLFRVPE